MKREFAIDTTQIVLAEMFKKAKEVKTEVEFDTISKDYAKRLVDLLHIPFVSNLVCPINNRIKQDKCIYRGDKCRVCLDE